MNGSSNIKVKIGSRTFKVEIADIHARPVIAIIDGEEIEIWPQTESNALVGAKPVSADRLPASKISPPPGSQANTSGVTRPANLANTVRAPIPGTILSVEVQAGDEVTIGQDLLTIEAMKMKNVLRAARTGTIASVKVFAGQTVKHNDILIEYTQ